MKKCFLTILTITMVMPVVFVTACLHSSTAGSLGALAFTVQPAGATAGSVFTTQPVVSVVNANENVVRVYTGTVTLAITSGTGTSGANLLGTMTVTVVNGVAIFTDLSIDTAGTAYTLTATARSLTSATSHTFNVATATATS